MSIVELVRGVFWMTDVTLFEAPMGKFWSSTLIIPPCFLTDPMTKYNSITKEGDSSQMKNSVLLVRLS